MTAPVREAIRFATVGVLQNGLNVAAFALATAVGVQYRVAAVLAGLVALVASSCSTASGHSHRARRRSTTRACAT